MFIKEIILEMYTAHVLSEDSRKKLAERYPPKYSKFIGHHVTETFGVKKGTEAPEQVDIEVVGYIDSQDGLEALVVAVNGSVKRPDGEIYHITWSLDPDKYSPKDSKMLLKVAGYDQSYPISIHTNPQVLS